MFELQFVDDILYYRSKQNAILSYISLIHK